MPALYTKDALYTNRALYTKVIIHFSEFIEQFLDPEEQDASVDQPHHGTELRSLPAVRDVIIRDGVAGRSLARHVETARARLQRKIPRLLSR